MSRDRCGRRGEAGERAGEALESSAGEHGGQRRGGGAEYGRRGARLARGAWEEGPGMAEGSLEGA